MLPTPPPRLSLAQRPTPFRLLSRISEELSGPRIWIKSDDLTGASVSGNKVRKLEYLLAEAKRGDCDTVITCGGWQSNHCRATALLCAQEALQAHLILRAPSGFAVKAGGVSIEEAVASGLPCDGNLLLDQLCGAKATLLAPREYFANLDTIFQTTARQYEATGCRPYQIPVGGTNAMGLWGYLNAAEELKQDFDSAGIQPDRIVCASGSGGTQGGLTLGATLLDLPAQVSGIAVCDDAEYFRRQIVRDVDEWQAQFGVGLESLSSGLRIETLENYIGPGYAEAYGAMMQCIRWVAVREGVILDPVYTGKAFYGMVSEIRAGRWAGDSDIVFIHTGGIFGVFPFRDQFVPVFQEIKF